MAFLPTNEAYSAFADDSNFRILATELAVGDCVVFVGAGASVDAGYPLWAELEHEMRQWAKIAGIYSPGRVADCCREVVGARLFSEFLERRFRVAPGPSAVHQELSRLPVRIFVTTNFDTLLEDGLAQHAAVDRVDVLTLADAQRWLRVPDEPPYPYVLKMHGCAARTPSELVVSEEDFLSFEYRYPFVLEALRNLLRHKAVLFIGYSLSDWNTLSVLYHVSQTMPRDMPNRYFVGFDLETPFRRFLEKRYQLRIFDLGKAASGKTGADLLVEFLERLRAEFEVPTWLRDAIAALGGSVDPARLHLGTVLASLFPGWDITARVRLAVRAESDHGVILPLDEIAAADLTVGDLVRLVRDAPRE